MSMINRNSGTGGRVVFVDLKGTPQEYMDGDKKKFGAFVVSHGKDLPKEVLPTNSAITGYVTSLDVQDREYQGDTINTLKIRVEDVKHEEPPAMISVTLGSYFSAKIVGLLNAADLSKPVTFNANVLMAGDKFGEGVADKDNVFPTMRQGTDNQRLKPVWAGGVEVLPDAPIVTVSGKKIKDMTPVNEVTAATIAALYAKVDALKETSGPVDDGIDANEVAAAVQGTERPRAN